MDLDKAFETNKATWNKKVAVHAESDFYDLESFKNGASSLQLYEQDALGDVAGKSMLHLQCHFGMDTLSWARKGARCTGIDISDEAIQLANNLSEELQLDASFVCCNVLDVSEHIKETFDIVFTSYGVIGWIPDLKPWAQMIAERLNPGGIFYLVEFHPIAWMFDYLESPPKLRYGYRQEQVIFERYEGTYADEDAAIISEEYGWNHGLSDVLGALLDAGLTIAQFEEYDGSPYNIFPNLRRTQSGLYELPDRRYPLIFEVMAKKPA